MKCPECNGAGKLSGFACGGPSGCVPFTMVCSLCDATGEIADTRAEWRRLGQLHRDERIAIHHKGLREYAASIGITAAELSDMERGRRDPSPLFKAREGGEG